MRSKPTKKAPRSRLFYYLGAALAIFFIYQWTSSTYVTTTPQGSSGLIAGQNSELGKACLTTLTHFHEVLTIWMGGNPTMTSKELWEELRLSEDVNVALMDGSKLRKAGLLKVLERGKGSSPGFVTKPVNVTISQKDHSHVELEFKELQASNNVVVTVLTCVANCRKKGFLSGQQGLETEIYSLKEHVDIIGEEAAAHTSEMGFSHTRF